MKQSEAERKYKGVMFDLDGTLLDTIEDLADSVNAALAATGLPTHGIEHYLKAVGDGARTMVERSLPPERSDESTLDQVCELTRSEYALRWNSKTRPYDGIAEMLDALGAGGLKLCIISNKPHHSTLKIVEEFLSDWDFAVVRGAQDGVPIKPDPQAPLAIADECGIAAEEWLYVGDTDTDMLTAKAAGFFAVGVAWGFRSVAELQEYGADLIAYQPADICAVAMGKCASHT
jgi:phosphoglycolate phosphatase